MRDSARLDWLAIQPVSHFQQHNAFLARERLAVSRRPQCCFGPPGWRGFSPEAILTAHRLMYRAFNSVCIEGKEFCADSCRDSEKIYLVLSQFNDVSFGI